MAGRGPQMSKPDQNEPNNDPCMNSEEVKYPLFVAEFLPPNHTSNKWVYIDQALLSVESWAIGVCTLLAMQPKLLQLRAALVPCSFGVANPALFLLALAGEEGVFRRHLGAVSSRLDTPDPIILLDPSTRELFLGLGSSSSGSQILL